MGNWKNKYNSFIISHRRELIFHSLDAHFYVEWYGKCEKSTTKDSQTFFGYFELKSKFKFPELKV